MLIAFEGLDQSGKETGGMTAQSQERFLRISDVIARTSLSRSYIYALIGRDEFPPPRKLGARCSRWVESEVDDWIAKIG